MDWEECIWDAWHTFDDEEEEQEKDNGPRIAFDFDKDDYLYHLQAEQ